MIGEKIAKYLSDNRISKAELIKKTGISRSGIDNIINGKTSPTIDTLEKIAKALEVSIYYFFDEPNLNEELYKNNQRKIEMYDTLSDFYHFLEFAEICNTTDLNQEIIKQIGDVTTIEIASIGDLMKYFIKLKSGLKAVVTLFDYVDNEKYEKSDLSKNFTHIYSHMYATYCADKKK